MRSALEQGGFYRLLCMHRSTFQGKQARETKLRDAVREAGLSVPDDRIGFLDADDVADWINRQPAVARRVRELLHVAAGGSFRSWHDERKRSEHACSAAVDDPRRSVMRAALAARAGVPRGVVRVGGHIGVGKSRLVLDAFGDGGAGIDGEETRSLSLFVHDEPRSDAAIVEAVEDLARHGTRAIVVWPQTLHDMLERIVTTTSSLSLLMLTEDLRECQAARPEWFSVAPATDETIEALLETADPGVGSDDRRPLVQLAWGYSGAALGMVSVWGDERFVSGLGHDALVERVVLGRAGSDRNRAGLMEAAKLLVVVGAIGPEPAGNTNHVVEPAALAGIRNGELRSLIADLVERGACRRHGRS